MHGAHDGYSNSMWTETYSGSHWGEARRLSAAGASVHGVGGIACPDATECIAVGDASNPGGADETLVDRDVDGRWTASTLHTSAGADLPGSLTAVTCSSPTACTAVGTNVGAASGLSSVACAPGVCRAVGQSVDSGTAGGTVLLGEAN